MGFKTFFVFWVTSLTAFAALGQVPAAGPTSDGLVRVQSAMFDELYVLPKTDLASYRKVTIDPAQVSMHQGWLKSINASKDVTRWLTAMDVRRITDAACWIRSRACVSESRSPP